MVGKGGGGLPKDFLNGTLIYVDLELDAHANKGYDPDRSRLGAFCAIGKPLCHWSNNGSTLTKTLGSRGSSGMRLESSSTACENDLYRDCNEITG